MKFTLPSRRLLLRKALIAAPALLLASKTKAGCIIGEGILCRTTGGALGLQTNLGSFFSLDNTLSDSTGAVTDLTNNNTVTFVSSTPSPIAAVTNSAKFVTASSQYLSHADATGLNVAGIDFSFQCWVYPTGNTFSFLSKSSGGFGSREYSFTSFFSGGPGAPRININSNGPNVDGSAITGSAWHHLVVTFNNTTKAITLYVDGASAATGTSTDHPAGTSNFNVGADAAGTGGYFGGNMCLVGIWRNRILSSGDVTSLYNSGAGLSYTAMA